MNNIKKGEDKMKDQDVTGSLIGIGILILIAIVSAIAFSQG